MARFISKYQRYALGIQEEIGMVTAQGVPVVTQPAVLAKFEHGGVTDWEVQEALEKFSFDGLPDGVNPALRLGVFDTDFAAKEGRWSDDMKAKVEEVLRTAPGRLGNDYIEVGRPTLPAPWPTYDEASFAKILNRVIEDGYAPADVLAYERETQKRPDVIDALERMIIDQGPPEDDILELIPA